MYSISLCMDLAWPTISMAFCQFPGLKKIPIVFLHHTNGDFVAAWPWFWSNYSDLTRPHPKWWFSKGHVLFQGHLGWWNIMILNHEIWGSLDKVLPETWYINCWQRGPPTTVDGSEKSGHHQKISGNYILPRKLTGRLNNRGWSGWKTILSFWNGSFLGFSGL